MEKTQAKPLTAAQQRQRDKKRRTWLRTGVQLFFFVSMPGAFVAGFSGVKQIFLHIGAGEVLSADSFTLSLLGLCGFTLLFDRFFCGYACAFGSLGDAVWALSGLVQKKLFHRKKQLRLPERTVLLGQKVKYLLLAGLVALYVTRQEKLLTGASPWEVFSRLTALRLRRASVWASRCLRSFCWAWRCNPGSSVSFSAPWVRCSPCCRYCPLHGCTGRVRVASRAAMPANSSARCT